MLSGPKSKRTTKQAVWWASAVLAAVGAAVVAGWGDGTGAASAAAGWRRALAGLCAAGLVLLAAWTVPLARRLREERTSRARDRQLAAAREAEVAHLVSVRIPAIAERVRSGQRLEGVPGPLAPPADTGEEFARSMAAVVAALGSDEAVRRERALRDSVQAAFESVARTMHAMATVQQQVLDHVEQSIDDPRLMAEVMKADHAAAQMTRKAQTLLVMCGIWPARRETRPVSLYDCVRGAQSRIVEFGRIEVHGGQTLYAVPPAVEGLMHTIAELLENATVFSPSRTQVQVTVREVGAGAVVEIDDAGLGMPPDVLAQAAAQLRDDLDLAQLGAVPRLGLACVGRWSRELGFNVELTGASAYGGTRAVTFVPYRLLTEPLSQTTGQHRVPQPNDRQPHGYDPSPTPAPGVPLSDAASPAAAGPTGAYGPAPSAATGPGGPAHYGHHASAGAPEGTGPYGPHGRAAGPARLHGGPNRDDAARAGTPNAAGQAAADAYGPGPYGRTQGSPLLDAQVGHPDGRHTVPAAEPVGGRQAARDTSHESDAPRRGGPDAAGYATAAHASGPYGPQGGQPDGRSGNAAPAQPTDAYRAPAPHPGHGTAAGVPDTAWRPAGPETAGWEEQADARGRGRDGYADGGTRGSGTYGDPTQAHPGGSGTYGDPTQAHPGGSGTYRAPTQAHPGGGYTASAEAPERGGAQEPSAGAHRAATAGGLPRRRSRRGAYSPSPQQTPQAADAPSAATPPAPSSSWTPEAARASIASVVSGSRRGRAAVGDQTETRNEHDGGRS
ncbi:ATP-binding protein [Streptomyces sp. MUM 178J]|uniref:ATP-binding protein n=1 Tax=Streptomyces sp. MUM 178J TaxID=2791991 RepID=UPI001F035E26|nr:ATP-binding protein [Streptomyces sp. MUM 178J]WRQ79740.1 ATP-binding protein [Streptomyces sp. MUM 178J]